MAIRLSPRPFSSRHWASALALLAALAIGGVTQSAQAASKLDSAYTYGQTYGSALRLLKVDMGVKVTETNPDWGYLLFVYVSRESGKRENRGSFSFVKRENGRVHVSVQLAEMPNYHEQRIIEKLRRKLAEEHGSPPTPKEAPPEPEEDAPDNDDKGSDGTPAPKKPSDSERRKPKKRPRWQRIKPRQ